MTNDIDFEEKAKMAVDKMVERGLDCSSMMHRKIEDIVEESLRSQHDASQARAHALRTMMIGKIIECINYKNKHLSWQYGFVAQALPDFEKMNDSDLFDLFVSTLVVSSFPMG